MPCSDLQRADRSISAYGVLVQTNSRSTGAEVYSITGAPESLSDEQGPRTRRYLISMSIRTACVILAILVPGWPRWVFLAGAVVLPYLAVVAANAGRRRRTSPGPAPFLPPLAALPPGRGDQRT
ncbi:MAG: DUF3099 domain-containing protein [Actinobacteria bacterium]|nr:DUF3099 domain-containing protein [Actinomycetota bacterium]